MAKALGGGPPRRLKGRGIRGRAGPDLALSVIATHARGELEIRPVAMAGQEAVHLVRSKGAIVKVDDLPERHSLVATESARGERQ
eukprot:502774-Alexandrium_andersonii.AAC.1